MKNLIKFILVCLLHLASVGGFSQKNIDPKEIRDKMQWFADAKLGIFIHAGRIELIKPLILIKLITALRADELPGEEENI
jgi:hypothetical protein